MFQLRRESQNFSPEKVIIVLVETLSHEIVIKIQFFNSREIILYWKIQAHCTGQVGKMTTRSFLHFIIQPDLHCGQ